MIYFRSSLHVYKYFFPLNSINYSSCSPKVLSDGEIMAWNVKQIPIGNRVNMFWGKGYNNQERPNISHGKVLATCVAILGAHKNTIRLINDMLRMPVNRD